MKTNVSRFDSLVARYYPAVYELAVRLIDDPCEGSRSPGPLLECARATEPIAQRAPRLAWLPGFEYGSPCSRCDRFLRVSIRWRVRGEEVSIAPAGRVKLEMMLAPSKDARQY